VYSTVVVIVLVVAQILDNPPSQLLFSKLKSVKKK